MQNNGGPTQTMALLAGSPANGAGGVVICSGAPVNGLDQRGALRNSAHGSCDIGAFDTGPSVSLSVTAPKNAGAGQPFMVTVSAQDAISKTALPEYYGTVHFTSSDTIATLPADYTFTTADHAVHTFSAALREAGDESIGATDTMQSSSGGSATVRVGTPINIGWTLIDLPLNGTGVGTASDLIGQLPSKTISSVATYSAGRFQLFVPGYSAPLNIQATQGIFVNSRANGTWLPAGTPYTAAQPVTLLSGWNLVVRHKRCDA